MPLGVFLISREGGGGDVTVKAYRPASSCRVECGRQGGIVELKETLICFSALRR